MSDEVVEQITIDPPPTKNKKAAKEKDPKKVAAGKKLAEYNRRAKEALARETARETKREEALATNPEETTKAWIPELSFTTVLSIVGIGFTAVDMFMRYYKNRKPPNTNIPTQPPPSQTTTQPPPPQTTTQPTPKIGML